LVKLLPCILCEKYINILALEMASPENRHFRSLWPKRVASISFRRHRGPIVCCAIASAVDSRGAIDTADRMCCGHVTRKQYLVVATVVLGPTAPTATAAVASGRGGSRGGVTMGD